MFNRALLAFGLYLLAFAFIWVGVDMAPAHGWPVSAVETNGCAALILGMILKTVGHACLVFGKN